MKTGKPRETEDLESMNVAELHQVPSKRDKLSMVDDGQGDNFQDLAAEVQEVKRLNRELKGDKSTESPSSIREERKRINWVIVAVAVIILLFIALGAVLALSFSKENTNDCDAPVPSPETTPSTTMPDDNPFKDDPKLSRLYSILEPIAPTIFQSDNTIDSSEKQAWQWLSKNDWSIDTNRESTPDWKIVERFVLAVLYFSTNGENWTKDFGFLSNSPVCDWKGNSTFHYGVRFCTDDGSVTMLHIPSNNLQGTIPSLLGLLSNLVSLDLPDNVLHGTLPSELSLLSNLNERLDFSKNQLEGKIPTSLGELESLNELFLRGNRFNGPIPSEISGIKSMIRLDLGFNQLSSSIPDSIGSITNLQYLKLDNNLLSGSLPSTLGNLSKIQKMHLFQNKLSGTVPSTFLQLKNLDYHSHNLFLHGNRLSGSMDFLCNGGFCNTTYPLGCTADCSEVECSCCSQCYASEVSMCSRTSVEVGCRIIMDDSLNKKSSLLEAKNYDSSSWHSNKDFPFQVIDQVDTDDPWTVYGWVDIENGPITYMPRIGVPDVNCSAVMNDYVMRNDEQLRFIPVPDYPCTEFGKNIIYFMIMEWFYFG